MPDPRRLFDAQDIQAAALYAKRASNDSADLYPVLVDEAGNLCINMTVGTVSLSSTASTITNAAANPVPVTGNINIASATLGTVTVNGNVSLTSTAVTASLISGQANLAAGVGASGASTLRNVPANDFGKTLASSSGTLTATQVTVLIAGAAKNKVYAFSLTTTSTTGTIASFTAGSGGTELWRVLLQAPSGANAGANLAVTPPAYLFASASNGTLVLNLSVAVRVDFSVAYYNEV